MDSTDDSGQSYTLSYDANCKLLNKINAADPAMRARQ